jgi:hypothetical protein
MHCYDCDRLFGSHLALQQHIISPAHDFECEVCDRSFGTQQSLDQHLDSPAHKFECEECDRTFRSQQSLDQHLDFRLVMVMIVRMVSCQGRPQRHQYHSSQINPLNGSRTLKTAKTQNVCRSRLWMERRCTLEAEAHDSQRLSNSCLHLTGMMRLTASDLTYQTLVRTLSSSLHLTEMMRLTASVLTYQMMVSTLGL